MFVAIIDHLWQSTLIVIVAWLATIALRRHGAQWRYWIWFAASMKFLLPFALIAALGARLPWPESIPVAADSEWQEIAVRVLQPTAALDRASAGPTGEIAYTDETTESLASRILPAATAPAAGSDLSRASTADTAAGDSLAVPPPQSAGPAWPLSPAALLLGVWLLGTSLLVARWGRSWLGLRDMLRRATPLEIEPEERHLPELRACSSIMEPGIFGIFKPVLLIPEQLVARLSREQLRAIVRHERMHVERHDNLTASLHMLVEALFWFHPLVWWIGARMVEERERACDEAVLASGVDPDVYASGLIEVCDFYLESPLICAAGVGGGSLHDRVRRIADNAHLPALGRLGRAALVAVPAVLMAVPLGIGLLEVQSARAQQANADRYGELLACVNPDVLDGLVFRGSRSAVVSDEFPPEMAGITPPGAFEWIGSHRSDISSSLPRIQSTVTAGFKTSLTRDAALEAAMAALAADGWQKGTEQQRFGGGAFAGATPAQPEVACMDDRSVSVNVNELDGTTYVGYGFANGQMNMACQPDGIARLGNMPGGAYMPTLDFPPDPETGRPPRRGGSGSSGTQSRVGIFHSATLGELANALSQQLVEQGWQNDASWGGTTTAGSSWTKLAADDTRVQGTLDLTDTGETSYTIMFRIVTLQ